MKEMTLAKKLRSVGMNEGAILRVSLEAPPGNVIDATMTEGLSEIFRDAARDKHLKAIVLAAEGDHFCFGASVEEHLPENVAQMLSSFHELFRLLGECSVPVVAAVRGSCLGGGLELAAFCHRVIAHPDAKLGQPEIALGVIAPVASAILAERVGRGNADDLLLSGRVVKAQEALEMGLVDQLDKTPEAAALTWVEKHLLPRSASSLRFATRAARLDFQRRFDLLVADLESLYLNELMATADAKEGISAFLEKRKPSWSDA